MRLVADESCDFAIVRDLRAAKYDIVSIAETIAGASDERVIALVFSERRLLLTEDKDFGQLVYAAARDNSGVVLIRYPAAARSGLVNALLQLLAERGDTLYKSFVVMEPGRIRLGLPI